MIVGAGNGGYLLLSELLKNPELGYRPVGFVDDDPRKQGMRVSGVEVLGTTEQLPEVLEDVEPDEVLIAVPSALRHDARAGGQRLPRARRGGADDADRVRAAASTTAASRASCARCASRTCSAATR